MEALPHYNLVALRDLILSDPVAISKWAQVVEHIVNSPAHERRIKAMLTDNDFADAVLESLRKWNGDDGNRCDLAQVLSSQIGRASCRERV